MVQNLIIMLRKFSFLLLTVLSVNAGAQSSLKIQKIQQTGMVPVVKTIQLHGGVELEYAEQGNRNGIPVILLHGLSDSWTSFETAMSYLPPSFHVFAISQRGHGNSSKQQATYDAENFADDIANFINEKKLGSVILVGHSMGSTNAQCFATRFPSLVKGLVLVASFPHYEKPLIGELSKVIDELQDPIDPAFVTDFQKSTITKPIGDEKLNGFIHESLKVKAHVWKGVAAGWNKANYLNLLMNFKKPALIMWGSKDPYCPKEDQEALSTAIKSSKLIIYEGIGHAIHWEEPQRFAKDLETFISSIVNKR